MPNDASRGRLLTLIGLAILAYFVRRLDSGRVHCRLPYAACTATMVATVVLTVDVRATRWQEFSGDSAHRRAFWDATVLGYVGTVIYPARAGQALRVVAACRSTRIVAGRVIARSFADRLADMFMLGAVRAGTRAPGLA